MKASGIKAVLFGVFVGLPIVGIARADFTVGEPVCVSRAINSAGCNDTQGCSFLHDGLRLYFAHNRPGGYGCKDIWVATRETTEGEWGEPVNLGPNVNTSACESYPAISPDELELYLIPGAYGTTLLRSTRASKDQPWGPATRFTGLGEPACDPDISADGLTIYFDSNRSGGHGGWDIWMATRETSNAPWGDPVNLGPNVNDSSDQYYPSISNDGLALFYCDGGLHHISVATRATKEDPWRPPVLLGPSVNGQGWVIEPEISPDGSTLYFDSGRSGGFNNENFWQASITPVVDFNGDAIVDVLDLSAMIEYWGTDNKLYDIGPMPWGDGIVDVQDLLVLAEYIESPAKIHLPIAHWALDETEGFITHDSVGTNDGTVIGTPVWQPASGQVNGALGFDGGTYIAAGHILSPLDGPFSVLARVKGGTAGQVFVSQQGGTNWLRADPATGALMTELQNGGRLTKVLYSDAVVTDGAWHRIAFTWDGSHRRLYVDDLLVAEDTEGSLAACYGGLNIGCGKDMSPATFFTGLIDDIRIYNRAVRP